MGEPVGELAVVGEQDQPRTVDVESSHGIQPQAVRGHELSDRPPPVCVTRGGDDADGLVERIEDTWLGACEELPVERHAAALLDITGWVGDGLAGNRYPPGGDQRLGSAPRGNACMGEELC